MFATSDPAFGSLMPRQAIFSPLMAGARYRSFCSSVPNLKIGGVAISLCTATAMPTEPDPSAGHLLGDDDGVAPIAALPPVLARVPDAQEARGRPCA